MKARLTVPTKLQGSSSRARSTELALNGGRHGVSDRGASVERYLLDGLVKP